MKKAVTMRLISLGDLLHTPQLSSQWRVLTPRSTSTELLPCLQALESHVACTGQVLWIGLDIVTPGRDIIARKLVVHAGTIGECRCCQFPGTFGRLE